jgi:hypothetical protein
LSLLGGAVARLKRFWLDYLVLNPAAEGKLFVLVDLGQPDFATRPVVDRRSVGLGFFHHKILLLRRSAIEPLRARTSRECFLFLWWWGR